MDTLNIISLMNLKYDIILIKTRDRVFFIGEIMNMIKELIQTAILALGTYKLFKFYLNGLNHL